MFDSPPPYGDPHHCSIHVKNFIDTHCTYTNGEHLVLLCVQLQFLFDVLEHLGFFTFSDVEVALVEAEEGGAACLCTHI